jgi:cell division transport system permease protein
MNFWFGIREGLKGFGRARLATTLTITSIAFSHLLIGIFIVFSLNVESLISDIRSKMEFEVYLESTLSEEKGRVIEKKIRDLDGVESVAFISKEQAAQRFEEEFGRNIDDILSVNPLPPSCIVQMKEGFRNLKAIEAISVSISGMDGVDEVIYQKRVLALIDRYITILYLIGGGIGLILMIIAAILLHNTIRLTIFARRDIIEIMNLVGATKAFINRPFLVEGFLQGLFGSILAGAMLYLVVEATRYFIYPYLLFRYEIFAILILLGILIGFFSSRLSVTKHLPNL